MKQIAVIGIDLAKNVFQVHGTDAAGQHTHSNGVAYRPGVPITWDFRPIVNS